MAEKKDGLDSSNLELIMSNNRKLIERMNAEREKLNEFGKIGQKVKIVRQKQSGREEVEGVITAIFTHIPFPDQETVNKWLSQTTFLNIGLIPMSQVDVFTSKGMTIPRLKFDEWEPV